MGQFYLPGVLGWIAEELGEEVAVKLAQACGGREIYIATNPRPEGQLVKALGMDDARAVAKLLGAGDLLVPCGNIGGEGGRRAQVQHLYRQGLTHSQIAEQVGVHIRTVERATARLRSEDQPMLPL